VPEPKQSRNGKHIVKEPKLTNRGGAGLLSKLSENQKRGIVEKVKIDTPKFSVPKAKYQIAPALTDLITSIDSVHYDPDNARLHPERNIAAIKESLISFGQVKPIVVQRSTMKVVAGNGTLQCMKELGYKKVAACVIDMSDAEAAAFGIADNKTAELAKWDFQSDVLKRLDKTISEAGYQMIGWSSYDLEVLRIAEWKPPEITEDEFKDGMGNVSIKCTGSQYSKIDEALNEIHNELVLEGTIKDDKELSDVQYLLILCEQWWEMKEECHARTQTDEEYKDLNDPANFV
jgi:ParB-like nuclease family protein